MPPARKCECGSCERCSHRDYMRTYYYSSGASGGWEDRSCELCGESFRCTGRKAKGHRQRFCSRVCKVEARRLAAKLAREQAKPDRSCVYCGVAMPKAMRANARFCSAACNSAAHNLKHGNSSRRLRGTGRSRDIQRAAIIARDRSRCHICGKKCKPGEITLDHLVPLSLGGTHDESNLAVACLSCNCAKGNRPMGEQLLLVG